MDSSAGTMLNSFYEFNFETLEGRQLRVELAVTPLKILPALMGHSMVAMEIAGGQPAVSELRMLIFGGVNRQGTIVHVVYSMKDTGLSNGTLNDHVELVKVLPPRLPVAVLLETPPPEINNPSLAQDEAAIALESPKTDTTLSIQQGNTPGGMFQSALRPKASNDSLRINAPSVADPSRPSSPQVWLQPMVGSPRTSSRGDPLHKHLSDASRAELVELRRENEELRSRIAVLDSAAAATQLVIGSFSANGEGRSVYAGVTIAEVLDLLAKTEEAFVNIRHLGERWAQIYRTAELSCMNSLSPLRSDGHENRHPSN